MRGMKEVAAAAAAAAAAALKHIIGLTLEPFSEMKVGGDPGVLW